MLSWQGALQKRGCKLPFLESISLYNHRFWSVNKRHQGDLEDRRGKVPEGIESDF